MLTAGTDIVARRAVEPTTVDCGVMLDRIVRKLLPPLDRFAFKEFYGQPFTAAPKASRDEYLALWEKARTARHENVDAYLRGRVEVDREWLDRLALRTQVVVKTSELCYEHGRLLYSTLYDLAKKSDSPTINVVETGTARGFSSVCMARALADAGKDGKIITFDVLPHDQPMYWNCIADHEKEQSRRELLADYTDLLDRYIIFHQGDTQVELPKVSLSRVHFAFLDGVHTYEYVMFEFGQIRGRQHRGDQVFFDDYTPAQFPGVVKAVDEICERYGYDKQPVRAGEKRGYVIATKR